MLGEEEDGVVEYGEGSRWGKVQIVGGVFILLVLLVGVAAVVYGSVLLSSKGNEKYGQLDEGILSEWEEKVVDGVSACRLRCGLSNLCETSHVAGTYLSLEEADKLEESWIASGLNVVRDEYEAWLSYPTDLRYVQVLKDNDVVYDCKLEETPYPDVDPVTNSNTSVPPFFAYSGSGEVEGPVVYANYGTEDDFNYLEQMGISVAGKIVLVKMGDVYRGTKVVNAEQRGAAGLLAFTDPADSGYGMGEVYPDGPWRPEQGVEKGSIWTGEGDPTTPGYPSNSEAPRLTEEELYNSPTDPMSQIPSLPLSYGDALPILEVLDQVGVNCNPPEGWKGGLPVGYCLGPGGEVKMGVKMEEKLAPIRNLIAKIEGDEEKDRIVLVGNHRDAWSFGGADPNSGTTVLAELGRVLGALQAQGWKPRRSIWLCSWDAEEYALIGSTEFAERHEQLLLSQAIAYINVDISVEGTPLLSVDGNPTIGNFFREVTKLLPSPASENFCRPHSSKTKKKDICCYCNGEYDPAMTCPSPTFDSWDSSCLSSPPSPLPTHEFVDNSLANESKTLFDLWELHSNYYSLDVEGTTLPTCTASGLEMDSDFGPFLEHLGIITSDINYVSTEGSYWGVYHSNYDDFRWVDKFGDPGFQYVRSVTQFIGVSAMRLASLTVLNFNYQDYPAIMRQSIEVFKKEAPNLDFSSLNNAILNLGEAAEVLSNTRDGVVTRLMKGDDGGECSVGDPLVLRALNDRLAFAERGFLFYQGMKNSPWSRNLVWLTGEYAYKPFAQVGDAIHQENYKDAQTQIQLAAVYVNQCASYLNYTIC